MGSHPIHKPDLFFHALGHDLFPPGLAVRCDMPMARGSDGDDRHQAPVFEFQIHGVAVELIFENDDAGRVDPCGGSFPDVGPGVVLRLESRVERRGITQCFFLA